MEVIGCTFSKAANSGAVYYVHSETDQQFSIDVDGCNFNECSGSVCYFDVKSSILDQVSLLNNHYNQCKIGNTDTILLGISQTSDSVLLSIKNNVLYKCTTTKFAFKFTLNSPANSIDPISFENNTINFDDLSNKGSAVFLNQGNREVVFRNCTFRHCYRQYLAPYWASSIIVESFTNTLVEECKFDDCGVIEGGNTICIASTVGRSTIQDCSFNYVNRVGSAISTYTDNIKIINNKFSNCAENSICVECSGRGDQFELINNYFTGCNSGSIIGFPTNDLSQVPIIRGNIFERNQNAGQVSFSFRVNSNVDNILFENNTFKDQKSRIGGFGGEIITIRKNYF